MPEEDLPFNLGEVLPEEDSSFNLGEVLPEEHSSFNPGEVLPEEAAHGRNVGAECKSGSTIELAPKSLKRREEPD